MPTVFVVSTDWMLRANVRAELRQTGIEALGMESADEVARALAQGKGPSVVVLDSAVKDSPAGALATLARRVPVVLVASHTQPAPLLENAAAVLYRPVRIGEIVARVQELLLGQAA
jgi:DNA-binding response OmpR family regulator